MDAKRIRRGIIQKYRLSHLSAAANERLTGNVAALLLRSVS